MNDSLVVRFLTNEAISIEVIDGTAHQNKERLSGPRTQRIGYEERGVKTANGKIHKEQEQTEAQSDGA